MSSVLISALQDPMNPESCFRPHLFIAVHNIKPAIAPHELLRTIMHFFVTPHTKEEFLALVNRLLWCDGVIIESGNVVLDPLQSLDTVISYMCGFLMKRLEKISRANFRNRRTKTYPTASTHRPWPCCLGDIGLDGRTPHEAVTNLLRWAECPPLGHSIFGLLGTLAQFWEPYGLEIMQNHQVADVVRGQLVCSIDQYIHPAPPVWDLFNRAITSCRLLAGNLKQVELAMASHCPHFEEELFDVGMPLIPLLVQRGSSMTAELDWFVRMFKARHVRLPVPTELNTAELDPQLYNDDYYHARYQMLWLQRTQRCMHLLCPMDPTTAGAITNLTLCRRCMVVRYCGPECQRAAWDADMLPHRDLCNNVCAVRHSVGMDYKRNKKNTAKKTKDNDETDRSDKQWSQWLMRAGVAGGVATFKEKGVHETWCRSIWLYIEWLRRGKKWSSPIRMDKNAMRGRKDTIRKRFVIENSERTV